MATITIEIPGECNLDPVETTAFLSAKLYESGRLSVGHAAQLCGMSKVAFANILGNYGVSLINYTVEEAIEDANRI